MLNNTAWNKLCILTYNTVNYLNRSDFCESLGERFILKFFIRKPIIVIIIRAIRKKRGKKLHIY